MSGSFAHNATVLPAAAAAAKGPLLPRRRVLAASAAALLVSPIGAAPAAAAEPTVLVPGYRPDLARLRGRPLAFDPDHFRGAGPEWTGPRALLTRLRLDGSLARLVLPIALHHAAVAPDRRRVFLSSLEGRTFLLFDLVDFAPLRLLEPHDPGFVGGGHAVWAPEGDVVYVTERRQPAPFSGDPRAHEGRVVVRDGKDGRVLAVWPSGGIGPHDIVLMPDARTLAVAHYGSPDSGRGPRGPKAPGVVEPAVSFLDRHDGRLRAHLVGPDRGLEIRHLVALAPDRVVAIQTRLIEGDEELAGGAGDDVVEADDTVAPGLVFAPAPLLDVHFTPARTEAAAIATSEPWAFRQGQSLVFDARYGEVLVTFPSAHALVVIDARSRAVRRILRTTAFGLSRPRGIGLLPDGQHYVVSGNWRGLLVMRRGEHRPVFARSRLDVPFFGHSHLTVV